MTRAYTHDGARVNVFFGLKPKCHEVNADKTIIDTIKVHEDAIKAFNIVRKKYEEARVGIIKYKIRKEIKVPLIIKKDKDGVITITLMYPECMFDPLTALFAVYSIIKKYEKAGNVAINIYTNDREIIMFSMTATKKGEFIVVDNYLKKELTFPAYIVFFQYHLTRIVYKDEETCQEQERG